LKPKISKKTLGIIGITLATISTIYGVKNRKEINIPKGRISIMEKDEPTPLEMADKILKFWFEYRQHLLYADLEQFRKFINEEMGRRIEAGEKPTTKRHLV